MAGNFGHKLMSRVNMLFTQRYALSPLNVDGGGKIAMEFSMYTAAMLFLLSQNMYQILTLYGFLGAICKALERSQKSRRTGALGAPLEAR